MQLRWLKTEFEYNNWRRLIGKPRAELRLQQKGDKKNDVWENIPVEKETKFI